MMVTYQLQGVWPSPSKAIQDEVVSFWLAEGALPDPAIASQRACELMVVARNAAHQIVGVSTAKAACVDQLRFECFYYRTFVGSANRSRGLHSTGLVWRILQESHRLLNQRFQEGCDPNVLGIYMEIENDKVMRFRNDAVWQENGMNVVYIGQTRDGQHIRVWYFDGARIPQRT